MNWIEGIKTALAYIEEHLKDEIHIDDVAKIAYVSSFYFQKAFRILCNMSVTEYIRYRRLSLAGSEVLATDKKIIDIAMEYGYDSPDSFTKAFTRFHGVTPTIARKEQVSIKSFAPLQIQVTLKGGSTMDYKIIEKEAFTVFGKVTIIKNETAFSTIPHFWNTRTQEEIRICCGKYGVCIEENDNGSFKYMIADDYQDKDSIPYGFEKRAIPKLTWAVFSCVGALPKALQDVNTRIFSEWLPNNDMYEIAADYNIEMYSPYKDYPNGLQDKNYYSEIWIPVKKR